MNQDPMDALSEHVDKVLQAFAVHESKSFTLAAQRLNTSQPALSRSIKTLEDALGFKLFQRTQAGVTATSKGEKVLDAAKDILDVLGQTASNLRSTKSADIEPIRIGTKEPFAVHVWPAFVTWLRQQNRTDILEVITTAELYIDKRNAHLEEQFRNHKLDALLVAAPSGLKNTDQYELFESQHRLYMAGHHERARFSTARDQCFLYKDAHISLNKTLTDVIPASDLKCSVVQSFDAARALAAADLGTAILPNWIASSGLKDRSLTEVRSEFASALAKIQGPKIYFCLRSGADKSFANLARHLKRFCREVYLR